MTHVPVPDDAGSAVLEPGRRRRRARATVVRDLVLGAVLLPVLVVTLARAVGVDRRTPFAQVVSMTPWLGAVALLVLVVALVLRGWWVCGVAAAVVVVQVVWLAPLAVADGPVVAGRADVRVMTFNAYLGRADADAVVRAVRAQHVEVLALEEVTPDLLDRLHAAGLDDVLPHSVTSKVSAAAPYSGTGIWSTLPLEDVDAGAATWFAMPSATITVGGARVRVLAVHTASPAPGQTSVWGGDLRHVRDELDAGSGSQLALGDFNATRDHSELRDVLGDRFVDAADRAGAGFAPTWPANRWYPPVVAIDHVVTDRSTAVRDVRVIRMVGSDHEALVATVSPGTR